MENFIVSARKYRPATFDMVVGQDTITNTLKSAIRNRHLAHSYLFCGPRGVGKTTCARIFAKTINCDNLSEAGDPCDKCESCLSFNSLRSFNIHELDAASNNKVDDIRSLTDQVRIPPQVGRYSIYIIDEVHMLSSSAFNAFLKTLEEPPAHAIFILATTEKHKIIPTILSRCQIFDFNRIRVEDIVRRLVYVASSESVTCEEDAMHVIAQKADGALRDALSIFDQLVSLTGKSITYRDVIENLNVLDYEFYFRSIDSAIKGDLSKILLTFNEVLGKGFDGHNFIAGLSSHLRDLLVSKDQVTLKLLEATPAVKQRYLNQAADCSIGFLYRALDICSACDTGYKNSKNQRLHVELALIKICHLNRKEEQEDQKKNSEVILPSEKPSDRTVRTEKKSEPPEKTKTEIKSPDRVNEVFKPQPAAEHGSVSIRELLKDNAGEIQSEKSQAKETENAGSVSAEDFTALKFTELWSEFASEVQGDGPRVASMFKSIQPEVHPDNTVTLHLSNAAQKDFFRQNYRQKLINLVDSRFGNEKIIIEEKVDMSETDGIIYTDEQKYGRLSSKYPSLRDFRKAFNLDFE